jgi:hypothetical protein
VVQAHEDVEERDTGGNAGWLLEWVRGMLPEFIIAFDEWVDIKSGEGKI